ncbi:MAG: hypothetical protein P0Y65_20605 [Candidatus Devosia phytovorans]|uniref:Uncharacterized protein n=1 Tax=Candidatus Devosia phytovorans TaxID=3121372 RepID=A0AAJ5VTJ3_9HYPH|nr:hypothetical protein [Devosia sp.]WEK04544.1 MAG: hypothetical protein P0Y65_20605 [Devosia sp.]
MIAFDPVTCVLGFIALIAIFVGACIFFVPYRAIEHGRQGCAVELNPAYFLDGCHYVKAEADEKSMPDLFRLMTLEHEEKVA